MIKKIALPLLILQFVLINISLKAEDSNTTNKTGQKDLQISSATIKVSSAIIKVATPTNKIATPKSETFLRSEIKKLWREIYYLKRRIPSHYTINRLADKRAAILINNYLGSLNKEGKRIPISQQKGGLRISTIILQKNKTIVTLKKKPIAIVLRAYTKKTEGKAKLFIYALPKENQTIINKYLISYQKNIPAIKKLYQPHFNWDGKFISGKKAALGTYKIFCRMIITDSQGKVSSSAMRYWGKGYGKSFKKYFVVIK